jgi:TfoX/Sxy family transcriptional regulator of competence genes
MRIRPPSPALIELFGRLLPATGGVGRTMFGCPCGFIGGNMFVGLFEDKLFVRLAEADRTALLACEGAELFDPMGGRPMREYVVVPAAWLEGDDGGDSDARLAAWVAKAARYGKTLPPKARKAAAKRKPAKQPAGKRRR